MPMAYVDMDMPVTLFAAIASTMFTVFRARQNTICFNIVILSREPSICITSK